MNRFHPSQLAFSKIDQTSRRGGMVNLTLAHNLSIPYGGTGRRVPEDLEEASADALWKWVFAADEEEENTTEVKLRGTGATS